MYILESLGKQTNGRNTMSKYQPHISANKDGSFYALVVREQKNTFGGSELVVVGNYKGRHFATRKAAEKSIATYISKIS